MGVDMGGLFLKGGSGVSIRADTCRNLAAAHAMFFRWPQTRANRRLRRWWTIPDNWLDPDKGLSGLEKM